ncbi:MAG: SET domain-containing protein-lysine N-methyltransferase, partial [Candidatus Woesearchaeota archaeon]
KYINHSCSPNCESINMNGHIWICARKSIKKGDELSYDYGYDHENHKEHPCKCGSKNCIGYIVARKHWKKVRNV